MRPLPSLHLNFDYLWAANARPLANEKGKTDTMKRIFVAAFIAVSVACVQAAAFQWSSTGTIYTKGSDSVVLNGFTAYLFDASVIGQSELLAGIRGGASINDYASLSSFSGDAKVSVTPFTADLKDGTMLNTYFAIVQDDGMYISKVSGKAAQSVGTATIAFGNQATTSKTVLGGGAFSSPGWYNVPEPTSGLLLVLGMAGLALKRKRA